MPLMVGPLDILSLLHTLDSSGRVVVVGIRRATLFMMILLSFMILELMLSCSVTCLPGVFLVLWGTS